MELVVIFNFFQHVNLFHFEQSLLWRANNKIDRLLDSGPDAEMLKRYPFYLDGVDKQGRPVLTIPYGTWDVRSLIEAEGPDRMVLHLNLLLESVMAQVREKTIANKDEPGRNNGLQFVVVSNMDGYSYRQLANMSGKSIYLSLNWIMIESHFYMQWRIFSFSCANSASTCERFWSPLSRNTF